MTILVVEDDKLQLDSLKCLLKEYQPQNVILCASNYAQGLAYLAKFDINLFLLDVELDTSASAEDGIELARQIRKHPKHPHTPIIFLTSIPERILEALNQTHCYDYLLKPYDREALYRCLDHLTNPRETEETYISFADIQGIHIRLKSSEVLYFSSAGHQIQIHTTDCLYTTCTATLDAWAEKLDSSFLRCHRKYIINLNYANHYDKTNRFVSIENESIPVGRSYKNDFEERYTQK